MPKKLQPQLNQWYQDKTRQLLFQVVEINNDYIELEFRDGDIEQLSPSEWAELDVQESDLTKTVQGSSIDFEFDDDSDYDDMSDLWTDSLDSVSTLAHEKDDDYQ